MSEDSNVRFYFKGPPNQLESEAAVVLPMKGGVPVPELEFGNQRHALRLLQSGSDEPARSLRLELPSDTSPGTIEATVHFGGKSYPATIVVEELSRIVTEPRSVSLSCLPGSRPATTVRVTNAGNIRQQLEPQQTILMRHADAISRGVRKAFKNTSGDLISRMIVLGEELSSEPIREVRFDIKADSNELAAGDQQSVEIGAEIPRDIDRSVSWKGSLVLFRQAINVTLDM